MTESGMFIFELPPGSRLRITTFDFLSPDGRKIGLLPPPTVKPPVQDGWPSNEKK